jgi:hypothetical protein
MKGVTPANDIWKNYSPYDQPNANYDNQDMFSKSLNFERGMGQQPSYQN